MGVIEQPTGYQQQTTGTTANDMAINQSAAVPPPSYENEKSQHAQTTTTMAAAAPATQAQGVPGQPRTDDPAHAEKTVANNQPPAMVTPLQALAWDPAWIDCPFCQKRSLTNVRKAETDTTWMYTFLCCICCGCIGAIFPLIFGWGADFDHYCNSCNNRVARRPHDGASNTQVQVFGPVPGQAMPGQAMPGQAMPVQYQQVAPAQQVAPVQQQQPPVKHA